VFAWQLGTAKPVRDNAKALHDTDVLAPVTRRGPISGSRPKYKIEARSFGESSEVPVSREERNPSVDAALGNQRVAEACLAALRQHLRS
jgi:hypothetical protein